MSVNAVCEEPLIYIDPEELTIPGRIYVDNLTGERLDYEDVKEARAKEMALMDQYEVYTWVRVEESEGHEVIDSRFNDTRKASGVVRSRCVGRQYNVEVSSEYFAGTPPLPMVKLVLSRAASRGRNGTTRAISIHDIEVAFFHATLPILLYCWPPREIKRDGWMWRLNKALYGTRIASQAFQTKVREMYSAHTFYELKGVPCAFYCPELDSLSVHHGDDFISEAEPEGLDTIDRMIEGNFATKTQPRIGPGYSSYGAVLNRTILFNDKIGYAILPDCRHSAKLVELCEVEKAKPAPTPSSRATGKSDRMALEPLTDEASFWYRSGSGTLRYVSEDRFDLQFAALQLAQDNSSPKAISAARMKRVARYMLGTQDYAIIYAFQDEPTAITCQVDGDWSGELTCRSISAGVLLHGGHLLESWSVFQKVCSLSSAESEFYAIGSGAARGLMIKNVICEMRELAKRDTGIELDIDTDSTAARGMIHRHGVGRVRHLATRYLWTQESQRNKDFKVNKVDGKENTGDLGTKAVDQATLERLLPRVGVRSLRSLGWHLPQTALTTIIGLANVATASTDDEMPVTTFITMKQAQAIAWLLTAILAVQLACALSFCMSCSSRENRRPRRQPSPLHAVERDLPATAPRLRPSEPEPPAPSEGVPRSRRTQKRDVLIQGPSTYLFKKNKPEYRALSFPSWGAVVTREY